MARKKPTILFGVHNFTPYKLDGSGLYGISHVLGNSSFTITGELIELKGGSQKAAWAVEDGDDDMEISLAFKHVENWMFELFLGATVSQTNTPSTGEVTGFENAKGASLKGPAGIASIGVKTGSEGDLKRSRYLVIAASATTVNVYALTDVDFGRGTKKDFIDDSLKINASPLTITTAGVKTDVPGFGIELVGGANTIDMTPGDSAYFDVFPAYGSKSEILIGEPTSTRPEFGALMVAQKSSTKQLFDIDAYRCKGSGMPIGLTEKAFAEPEVTAKPMFDPVQGAVAKISICA